VRGKRRERADSKAESSLTIKEKEREKKEEEENREMFTGLRKKVVFSDYLRFRAARKCGRKKERVSSGSRRGEVGPWRCANLSTWRGRDLQGKKGKGLGLGFREYRDL